MEQNISVAYRLFGASMLPPISTLDCKGPRKARSAKDWHCFADTKLSFCVIFPPGYVANARFGAPPRRCPAPANGRPPARPRQRAWRPVAPRGLAGGYRSSPRSPHQRVRLPTAIPISERPPVTPGVPASEHGSRSAAFCLGPPVVGRPAPARFVRPPARRPRGPLPARVRRAPRMCAKCDGRAVWEKFLETPACHAYNASLRLCAYGYTRTRG